MPDNTAEPDASAQTRYTLPSNAERGECLHEIQACFPTLEIGCLGTRTGRYFDTFDWRLFRRGLALCQAHDTVALWSLDNRPIGERTPCLTLLPWVGDWLESPLKARLLPVVSIRALTERAVVHASYFTISEREAPHRPVANIVFEEGARKDRGHLVPFSTQVEVSPYSESPMTDELRAWFTEFLDPLLSVVQQDLVMTDELRVWFTEFGPEAPALRAFLTVDAGGQFRPVSYRGPLATLCMTQQASAYSAKLAFTFEPDMRAADAVRAILAFLLDIVKRNRSGILCDIDTEFLHDFRVAIRRARSLLGQLPAVLPARLTKQLRTDLSFLGNRTNHLRDLDVFLLQRADCLAALPPDLRPDAEALFRAVEYERAVAHRGLAETLNTRNYETLLQDWETAATDVTVRGPRADRRLATLVRKCIRKQYRRVVAPVQPDALEENDPRRLHRLRIECKKLRYVFEFFASAFPQEMTAGPIRRLRALQDVLGQLNDLEVQQHMLCALARAAPDAPGQRRRTDDVVSGLTRTFAHRKERLRAEVRTTLADFTAEAAPWS